MATHSLLGGYIMVEDGPLTPNKNPCPECGWERKEAPGIGLFCPNPDCPRSDDGLVGAVMPPPYKRCADDDIWLLAARAKAEREELAAKSSAPAILKKAAALIEQRGVERDKPQGERTMGATVAAFWALHGESILRTGSLTETQGWEFMELLKMARSAGGCYKADDYEDKVAYAALAAESAAREETQ